MKCVGCGHDADVAVTARVVIGDMDHAVPVGFCGLCAAVLDIDMDAPETVPV